MATATALKMYSLPLDSEGRISVQINPRLSSEEAGRQLTRMARRLVFERRCSFTEALREVMDDPSHETLVKSYQSTPPAIDEGLVDPAVEAHERAQQHMTAKGEKSYPRAVRHVLAADRDLSVAYARTYQV